MCEDEWLCSNDAGAMLSALGDGSSERKLRLFAVACCRRISKYMGDDAMRLAINLAERHAESLATRRELESKRRESTLLQPILLDSAFESALFLSREAFGDAAMAAWRPVLSDDPEDYRGETYKLATATANASVDVERRAQADLLRDIFGNPFHPTAIDPDWLTPEVVETARHIYEERAFARLSDLANALERAKCGNPALLAHCRAHAHHVLGCWALDSVLGRG
jgi:hypothetical protein